jgi:threonine/homoserine/homoserine lactone efflux protein
MLELIARGAGLGVSATLIPGPLQTLIINSALAYGWRKSLLIALAPLIADIPVIVLTFTVLNALPAPLLVALRLIGGVFILYLAYSSYQGYRAGATMGSDGNLPQTTPLALLRRAVVVNILGPGPWVFWTTVHGPTVLSTAQQSPLAAILYVLAFYGIFFVGLTVIIVIFDRLRQLDPRITRRIILVSIIVLAFFGASLLWQGIGEAVALFQNTAVGVN